MNQEKFTERARGFIQAAQTLAMRANHQQLTSVHLLKVLLDDEEDLATGLITAANGDAAGARRAIETDIEKLPTVEGAGAGQVYLAPEMARLFDQAEQIAEKGGDSFVTTEGLLLALALSEGTVAATILHGAGVTPQSLNEAINDMRKGRKADSATGKSVV